MGYANFLPLISPRKESKDAKASSGQIGYRRPKSLRFMNAACMYSANLDVLRAMKPTGLEQDDLWNWTLAVASRQYGKPSKRTKAERLFAELPQSPVRKPPVAVAVDPVKCIAEQLSAIHLENEPTPRNSPRKSVKQQPLTPPPRCLSTHDVTAGWTERQADDPETRPPAPSQTVAATGNASRDRVKAAKKQTPAEPQGDASLRVLTWDDVCPPGDCIVKIAEASYAEVYRVSNERGTSIIKVIRLESPIKPQTKTQVKSGLVDEEPHSQDDVNGELQISEWLADIPGFVVYKERYLVQGKATKQLLETHQAFQRRMKRQDPGRAQFYPSPSRYVAETKFLAVELGDAGTALEDWELADESQLWDIFLLEAVALARAEDIAMFEHRDLHEGNLCVKRVSPPRQKDAKRGGFFGYSGLDITILDYGLSRAQDVSAADAKPVAFDLERDLSLFTSTHASQCTVYRQMRSFLLRADRKCIPPEGHRTPHAKGVDGPLSWDAHAPYTNVLWLAYLYRYLGDSFKGAKRDLTRFRKETKEMWKHLDPEAEDGVVCFGSAADVVCFAVEAGWIQEEQLRGAEASILDKEDSIIVPQAGGDSPLRRRSPRRTRQQA
ncbi:haspin like kinase domain-containing protein [Hirsutella rhossiliensis]|uniref:non-specific serine/threonine protein kinase n=1 Tax=Hirsutella rhossiliensis TaxID=111463 RepID=A0A9P8MZ72_9HYPO|nr:haspin like kinase domain-containing protein [Hirsutella rhossiliensis]KAH0962966.1 haspin like kinase domain-containing protein [Hirsutella rhossiliensis]